MTRSIFLVAMLLVAVRAQLLSKEEIEKLKAMQEACNKEVSIDRAMIDKALKGEYTDDPKFKDYLFCANKAMGFQNASGDIQDQTLIEKLVKKFQNEQVVTAAVKQCSQKKATPSDTAFELIKCLHSFAPKDLDIGSFF